MIKFCFSGNIESLHCYIIKAELAPGGSSFKMYTPLVHSRELFIRSFMKYFGPNGIELEGKVRERETEKPESQWVEAPQTQRAEQRGRCPALEQTNDLDPRNGGFVQERRPRGFSLLPLSVTFRV